LARLGVLAIALLATTFAVACADDGGDADTGGDAETATATAAATETAATATAAATEAATETATASGGEGTLTVYSGRSEDLVGPLLEQFTDATGIEVEARYADTAATAALLLEEGDRSPADIFFAQDAGALGAVQNAGLLAELDGELLERVPEAYRSSEGQWVGVSGRARVVVYNTDNLTPEDLPDSILDFTDPEWSGRIGWAPTNGSFQAWVTALRLVLGEEEARAWLEEMQANNPVVFPNNSAIVEAVGRGEIDAGFVNHYYLSRFLAEQGESFPARNYYTAPGDVGTLVNVAGVGILASSSNAEAAAQFVDYLLSEEAQRHFAEETTEYPLVAGVEHSVDIPDIAELEPLEIDLSQIDDLEGTITLLQETGILP